MNDFDVTADDYRKVPSATLLNAAVTYRWDRYAIGVFGDNLTDSKNISQIDAQSGGTYQPGDKLALGRPRTVGVRARVSF
ncbi:MAG: hypothetical protein WDM92_00800 [Caulobacteraceae bacterium]